MKKSLKDYAFLELDGQKWVRETPLHRAAPELLEALKDIMRVIATDDLVPESVSYMKQARAAIAKAEGKTE